MQHAKDCVVTEASDGFQSSPAPEGECNTRRTAWSPRLLTGFNPHPPLRASATLHRSTINPLSYSVFQSSPAPEGECNQDELTNDEHQNEVSILTRP